MRHRWLALGGALIAVGALLYGGNQLVLWFAHEDDIGRAEAFDSVASGVSSVVTAIGLVVAAVWAYFRLVRGRTFNVRLDIDPQIRMELIDRRHCLVVLIGLRNASDGLVTIDLRRTNYLEIACSDAVMYQDESVTQDLVWEAARSIIVPVFAGYRSGGVEEIRLEPTQIVGHATIVPLPAGTLAARVRVVVAAFPGRRRPSQLTEWTTESIVTPHTGSDTTAMSA